MKLLLNRELCYRKQRKRKKNNTFSHQRQQPTHWPSNVTALKVFDNNNRNENEQKLKKKKLKQKQKLVLRESKRKRVCNNNVKEEWTW